MHCTRGVFNRSSANFPIPATKIQRAEFSGSYLAKNRFYFMQLFLFKHCRNEFKTFVKPKSYCRDSKIKWVFFRRPTYINVTFLHFNNLLHNFDSKEISQNEINGFSLIKIEMFLTHQKTFFTRSSLCFKIIAF